MAEFCTKCGAPLGQGMQFCTSCGAAKGAPAAAAAPARPAAMAAAASPSATIPSASLDATVPVQAPKSGSPVLKIILIVVGILVLIGILFAASCVYFYRTRQRVRQFESHVHATFPTRPGSSGMHSYPSSPSAPPAGPVVDTGITIYPGATPYGGGSQASGPNGSIRTQQYTTSDSMEKVVDFYKGKLGPNTFVTQADGKALVQYQSEAGATTITIVPNSSAGNTMITIMVISGK